MGKKLGFSSLFFRLRDTPRPSSSSSSFYSGASSAPSPASPWSWPSCKQPRTGSFRGGDEVFKTVNSAYVDSAESSWFTRSSEERSETFSTTVSDDGDSGGGGESAAVETVIRGLRSDRLFFEPGDTNSILEEAKRSTACSPDADAAADIAGDASPFKESVALAMDSDDPYRDFRVSMEEMVAAHGLTDWDRLEELLVWHLKANGKKTHGFIVAAFVDLLVGLASPPVSSSSSSSSSSSFEIKEADEEEGSTSTC